MKLIYILICILVVGTCNAFIDQETYVSNSNNQMNSTWLIGHTVILDGCSVGHCNIPDNIYKSINITVEGYITEINGNLINVTYKKIRYYTYEEWWNLLEDWKYQEKDLTGYRWIPISWIDSGKVIIQ